MCPEVITCNPIIFSKLIKQPPSLLFCFSEYIFRHYHIFLKFVIDYTDMCFKDNKIALLAIRIARRVGSVQMKIKCVYLFWVHNIHILFTIKRKLMYMAHCPSCGKIVDKPSSILKNQCFTIEAYECGRCHHNFKVSVNKSLYIV